jgi:hypothetical protein
MTRTIALVLAAAVCCGVASPRSASAQRLPEHPWSHGTNLEVFGGAAAAPDADTRGVLGGAIGWDINQRLSIKGSGAWLLANRDDEAFAAEMKALVNLTPPAVVVPFVGAGVGLYRASFDTSRTLPDFYRRREPDSIVSGARLTFTDPAFVVEAGVKVFASRHVSVRPDVGIRLVTRDRATYVVTLAAVRVTYHFEVHDEIH